MNMPIEGTPLESISVDPQLITQALHQSHMKREAELIVENARLTAGLHTAQQMIADLRTRQAEMTAELMSYRNRVHADEEGSTS